MIEDEFSSTADDEYRAALIPLVDKATRPDDATPIACTLQVDAMPARIEDWAGMLRFVTGRSSVDGGLRLELDPCVPLGDLARLARAEQDCCQFFSFALTLDARGVGLEVRAPDDALLDRPRAVRRAMRRPDRPDLDGR